MLRPSVKASITKKLQSAIEKTKKKPTKAPREVKKRAVGKAKKATDLGDEEITSNDSSMGDKKDDFFIESEDGKSHILLKLSSLTNSLLKRKMRMKRRQGWLRNYSPRSIMISTTKR